MRRLENEDEGKFWEAWIKDETIFCYRFGKIGSQGHIKLKKLKTRADAEAELEEKLAEKLEEGFVELGAEKEQEGDEAGAAEVEAGEDPADEDESDESDDGESDESDEDESDESDEDESDGDSDDDGESDGDSDDDGESDGDSDDDGESDGDSDDDEESDGDSDDDEESDGDSDDDSEDEESGDEDGDDDAGEEPAAAVAEPPPKPQLPRRVKPGAGTPEHARAAVDALEALRSARSGRMRSWKVARLVKRARQALAALGGSDLTQYEGVAAALDGLMAQVIAPKRPLALDDALSLLWVVDAATYGRTVVRLRAKMLDCPVAPAIGILATVFEGVPDPEVAVHVATALVKRRLSGPAFLLWFGRIRPFLAEALASRAGGVDGLRSALKPGADEMLKARVAEVTA